MAAHDEGLARRFPVLWGLLTVTYAAAVAFRAITQSRAPGLPTFAAFSALAAVWLSFFDLVRARPHLQRAIILTIVATILLNTLVIITAALRGRIIPIEQAVFTFMFAYVLLRKLHRRDLPNSTSGK